MTRLTLYRIAIKGISQHNIPFIAKLPHANRGATDEKRHFRVLFHPLSVTNFSTKNHDNDSGNGTTTVQLRERFTQFVILLRERFNLVYGQGCGKAATAAMLLFAAWAVSLLTRPKTQTAA